MINLYNLKMTDMLPSSIKNDTKVIALANVLDMQMQLISSSIIETILLSRISELNEDVIDILAWQFHVDFYEPLGLDLNKKRELVKNSISWHRRKGTPSVLEEILKVLFLKELKIEEWFEYGGKPYFFILITSDNIKTKNFYEELIRAVYSVKNTRSWLELIRLIREFTLKLQIGMMSLNRNKVTTKYANPKNSEQKYEINFKPISFTRNSRVTQSFKYKEAMCIDKINTNTSFFIYNKTIVKSMEVE